MMRNAPSSDAEKFRGAANEEERKEKKKFEGLLVQKKNINFSLIIGRLANVNVKNRKNELFKNSLVRRLIRFSSNGEWIAFFL